MCLFVGTIRVHNIRPPFPRTVKGQFHILLAHIRQLHLTAHILRTSAWDYDVYFVDQLSTCVPIFRILAHKRVVFYCHFPDKLLANGAFVEGNLNKKNISLLKRIYRYPMDWLEEVTTSAFSSTLWFHAPCQLLYTAQADVILANSKFSARITKLNFTSLRVAPKVVYPGINIAAYEKPADLSNPDIKQTIS